jgi:hypothetical protein
VAAKLARSIAAGTVTPMGHFTGHGEGHSIHTRIASHDTIPEALYSSENPMPKADPLWAEAAKVGSGFFASPEEIAAAMGAPQYDRDRTYRDAVSAKIARSIRERFIDTDLQPLDPAMRFSRG